jgi:hypothetical protein
MHDFLELLFDSLEVFVSAKSWRIWLSFVVSFCLALLICSLIPNETFSFLAFAVLMITGCYLGYRWHRRSQGDD